MLHRLRKKREDKGFTISNMANILNYKSSSTYAKKEREEIPLNINEAIKIVMFLDCGLDEIFLPQNYLNKIIK